ncbi:hypothetical protein [Nannocystis exedens]|uniref:hypothetical protein n=1 Tax=Nannocystis exedens TaxID=54 RepID=UPI000C29D94D|nr:hypothetical protein [Nannocystis exedens]
MVDVDVEVVVVVDVTASVVELDTSDVELVEPVVVVSPPDPEPAVGDSVVVGAPAVVPVSSAESLPELVLAETSVALVDPPGPGAPHPAIASAPHSNPRMSPFARMRTSSHAPRVAVTIGRPTIRDPMHSRRIDPNLLVPSPPAARSGPRAPSCRPAGS